MSNKIVVLPEWQTLLNVARHWEYGTFKSHNELSDILYIPVKSNRYHKALKKVNTKLIEIGKMLKNVKGEGYRVVNPDEYLHVSNEYRAKGIRQLDTAHEILKNAPIEDMSEDSRRKLVSAYDRSAMVQSMLHSGLSGENYFENKVKLQINK